MSMYNHPYVAVQQQQQAPHHHHQQQQQQAFYPVVIGNQAPPQQQQQQAFFQPPQPQSTSSTSSATTTTTPQQPLYTEVPIRHSCSLSRFSCSVRNFFRGGNNGQKCRFIQLFQIGLILYIVATLLSFFFRRSSTFTLGNLICAALGLFALHKKNDVLMAVFTGLMTYKTLANIVGCFSGSLFYMSNYGYYYYRFSWMVICVVVFELVATVAGWAYVRRAFFKRGCAHHQNATAAATADAAAVVVEGPTVSDLIHNAQQENEHVVIPESQLQRLNVVEQPVLQASSSPINVPSVYPQATPSPVMMMQQQQPSVPQQQQQQQAPSTPFIYGTQMEVLRSMGFLDEQKNAHMLMKHNGDISSAVREIISV